MLALDFAGLVAKTTVRPLMAELLTTVRAVQKIATVWLTAAAMIGLDDKAFDSVLAVFAGFLAYMATCQGIATIF
jgi:hypothetical protein